MSAGGSWSDELARATTGLDHSQIQELESLQAELRHLERATYCQTLRLEEHDDPNHPVVLLAKQRIVELSARREEIQNTIRAIEAERDATLSPDEIESMLNAVPHLHSALKPPTHDAFAEILEMFDIKATYDKPNRTLTFSATLTHELAEALKANRPPQGRSGQSRNSGGGIETPTCDRSLQALRIEEWWSLRGNPRSPRPPAP
jgi:hypothetical protein